jgi:hypothetical protein
LANVGIRPVRLARPHRLRPRYLDLDKIEQGENSASAHFVNGLSFAAAMAENHPPRRLGGHNAKPGERYPSDRERIDRARQAAEALFTQKPPVAKPPLAAKPALSARPQAATPVRREPVVSSGAASPVTGEISASQAARIRTWVKYGMTATEVAKICGVPVDEIERVLLAS